MRQTIGTVIVVLVIITVFALLPIINSGSAAFAAIYGASIIGAVVCLIRSVRTASRGLYRTLVAAAMLLPFATCTMMSVRYGAGEERISAEQAKAGAIKADQRRFAAEADRLRMSQEAAKLLPQVHTALRSGDTTSALATLDRVVPALDRVPSMKKQLSEALLMRGVAFGALHDAEKSEDAFMTYFRTGGYQPYGEVELQNPTASAAFEKARRRIDEEREDARQAEEARRMAASRPEQAGASEPKGSKPDVIGAKVAIEYWMKEHVADREAEVVAVDGIGTCGQLWCVAARVRGRNGFGGPIIKRMIFSMKKDGGWFSTTYSVVDGVQQP